MSIEQIARILAAITETSRALAKEHSYAADLRDNELVSFLEGHLVKLRGMLS